MTLSIHLPTFWRIRIFEKKRLDSKSKPSGQKMKRTDYFFNFFSVYFLKWNNLLFFMFCISNDFFFLYVSPFTFIHCFFALIYFFLLLHHESSYLKTFNKLHLIDFILLYFFHCVFFLFIFTLFTLNTSLLKIVIQFGSIYNIYFIYK